MITLHDVTGISHKSGTDQQGNSYVEFDADSLAEQLPGECAICGEKIEAGWLRLDEGDEVCPDHIQLIEE